MGEFTEIIEHDFYGSQKNVWTLLKYTQTTISGCKEINPLEMKEFTKYFNFTMVLKTWHKQTQIDQNG